MTLTELVHRLAVLLTGEDTPALHAYVDACLALDPPPTGPTLCLTPEEFDTHVVAGGGVEAVRWAAMAFYGIDPESRPPWAWPTHQSGVGLP